MEKITAKQLVTDRLVALHDRREAGSNEKVVGTMAERFLSAVFPN